MGMHTATAACTLYTIACVHWPSCTCLGFGKSGANPNADLDTPTTPTTPQSTAYPPLAFVKAYVNP